MKRLIASLLTMLLATGALLGQEQTAKLTGSLFVYCAAGVKAPVDAIAKQFEKETGVKVSLTFANSGQLLGQIETTKTGDVYIPSDVGFTDKAKDKKLAVGEPRVFCYFIPAIYVRKGNPKAIRQVSDLARPGLKLALADPSAAIGALQFALFKTNKLDEAAIKNNVVLSPATVIDVAFAVKMGAVDAGLIWDALGSYAPDEAELVRIPAENNVISVVMATTLVSTANPTAANAFLEYLASEKGKAILREKGFAVDKP
jgi:molybdate transport system substrate-binding protein